MPAVLSGRALAAPAQPHAYVLKHHRTKHDGSKSIDRQTRTAACSSCVVEHSVEASTTTPRGWVPIHHPTAFDAAFVLACIGIFRGTVSSIHPGANGDSFPAMLGRDSAHRLRIEPAPKACNFYEATLGAMRQVSPAVEEHAHDPRHGDARVEENIPLLARGREEKACIVSTQKRSCRNRHEQ